jgi:hypothetical protein
MQPSQEKLATYGFGGEIEEGIAWLRLSSKSAGAQGYKSQIEPRRFRNWEPTEKNGA